MRKIVGGCVASALVVVVLSAISERVSAQGQANGSGNGLESRVAVLESQVATLASQASVTALEGQVTTLGAQLSTLVERVAALELLNDGTYTVDVDCTQGQTIASALEQTVGRRELFTIRITGVCTENVSVIRGRIRFVGAGTGATIQAANANQPVISFVMGYSKDGYLSLNNLTITGGSSGVNVNLGNMLFVNGCVISNNSSGINISANSITRILGTVIENNAGDAVNGNGDAYISIGGGTQIQNNGGHGLRLQSSSADVSGSTQITNNGAGIGTIGLYAGSKLRLSNATIANNTRGIFAVNGSQVWLDNGAVITGNQGNGIAVNDTSVVGKLRSTTNVQITNNQGWGISCSGAPGAAQLAQFPPSGFAINLTGNTSGEHNCAVSPNPPGS